MDLLPSNILKTCSLQRRRAMGQAAAAAISTNSKTGVPLLSLCITSLLQPSLLLLPLPPLLLHRPA
jgi:hypothetical protein